MILAMAALSGAVATATIELKPDEVVLRNSRFERRIQIKPFVGTVSLIHRESGHEYLRSVEPEARLQIDGQPRLAGGVSEVPNRAYLDPDWLTSLKPHPQSIAFVGAKEVPILPSLKHRGRGNPPILNGTAVLLQFKEGSLEVDVRLEVYDGLPITGKQVTVRNRGSDPITIDQVSTECLALVEGESLVEPQTDWRTPNVSVLSDYAFGGLPLAAGPAVHWREDPAFTTQVNYQLKTPCLLDVRPPLGPAVELAPGKEFRSLKSYLLVHRSDERESRGLELRTAMRFLAPWTSDNPLMLHVVSTDEAVVKTAIDQASECGFEMVILSFGSGLNMEDVSAGNIAKFRALREYADAKNVRLGGYSLLASRRIDDANDVINPKTGKTGGAIFGNSPCLGSEWGIRYFANLRTFIEGTGFRMLEHDGNYPGDVCASTSHPGHKGLGDSQWRQWQMISEFYAWCRERDVFLNVPDTYFLAGSNKTAMGYRETNWSLPREQQHVHARQNLFDGTFAKTPSMGWMFVPLVQYHGGGAAATIEPLKDHLADYELHFANTLGYGAQACWRGTRLYDAPETKAMVKRMVDWYKKYREILESDIVHLRRADGRRLDFVLHVNPAASPRAMLVAYNPTGTALTETITVPHSGTEASVREREGKVRKVKLKDGGLPLRLSIPARGWTYFTFT